MTRIGFPLYQKLVEYSNQVPHLVDYYEKRDLRFLQQLKNWIRQVETTLKENGLSEASTFSNYRLLVLSAERGDMKESNSGYIQKKKARDGYAISALTQAQNSLQIIIGKADSDFEACKKILRRLLLIAISLDMLRKDMSFSEKSITFFWKDLLANPKTSVLVLQVLEIVNYSDALHLLFSVLKDYTNNNVILSNSEN